MKDIPTNLSSIIFPIIGELCKSEYVIRNTLPMLHGLPVYIVFSVLEQILANYSVLVSRYIDTIVNMAAEHLTNMDGSETNIRAALDVIAKLFLRVTRTFTKGHQFEYA